MNLQQTKSVSAADQFVPLFDWKPDIARFERDVDHATKSGRGDPLTLGEMQCSLDLIDAELLALRGDEHADARKRAIIQEWSALRGRLARLIAAMEPLVAE